MTLVKQKIRQKVIVKGTEQLAILDKRQQFQLYAIIRRKWQNLIERQFRNEGEAIPGKRTGYKPWADRKRELKFNEDDSYTRRISIEGKKETVTFYGRTLLQLSYPSLSTRYKRNIRIKSNGRGVYTLSIDYPELISGQGRNAEKGTAIIHQEGVSRRGIPARKLNIESFKSSAITAAREYLTNDVLKKAVVTQLRKSQKRKPDLQGPFILKSDNDPKFDIPF